MGRLGLTIAHRDFTESHVGLTKTNISIEEVMCA